MSEWKIVEKDGLPNRPDEFMVTVIEDEVVNGELSGRKVASVEGRIFNDGRFIGLDMNTLYAWREIPNDLPELPEGVVWDDWMVEE